ncbi:PH domain-containing protein [Streptomyces caniscabiei]|uniref:PH domain-containing protein n=1 Tax=Streptomyces caniscabiei TaxID=2746961 RepID=A0A927LAQ5_9ACTN|nr:PH domain-containing protein [Streptomyces caniscabiei]MBD9728492.1 PH domain-containing protein [Streptomyces caniscabiei]MDX3509524.1 PH domain-containing protein [Streptomyces caniscabiei]MDX3723154.1 PH domain-containing protein [Streptomyces caniscabiei]MDX3729986.1 PH domain-containing protein [Streptomyces caniscabiei]WEO28379.1 PH domain-containing protein [Streptomyces caniscabiei]
MPDQSSLPALPVTFRPGRTRAVLLSAAGAIFVVITVVALLLPTLGPGERLSFVFTAAMLAGVLGLLSRPKVVADDSGVTVVNITARRQLGWAEIVQVNLRVGDPWVFLDLTDGTSLPALGIQPGIAKQHAIEDARTLRALVEARSVAGPEQHQG